jgi:hypothetical protein
MEQDETYARVVRRYSDPKTILTSTQFKGIYATSSLRDAASRVRPQLQRQESS